MLKVNLWRENGIILINERENVGSKRCCLSCGQNWKMRKLKAHLCITKKVRLGRLRMFNMKKGTPVVGKGLLIYDYFMYFILIMW